MLWVRGEAAGYDHWRDLGNPGWGYDEVLSWVKRVESYARGDEPCGKHGRHGIEGRGVADASIMPAMRSSNTNAPSFLISERCARVGQRDDADATVQNLGAEEEAA